MVPERTLCTTELDLGSLKSLRFRSHRPAVPRGFYGDCSNDLLRSLPIEKISIDRIQTGTRACHCIKEAQIAINGDMRLTLVERSLKMGNKDRKKDKKKPKKTATKTPGAK
jgi:hypothetical protein